MRITNNEWRKKKFLLIINMGYCKVNGIKPNLNPERGTLNLRVFMFFKTIYTIFPEEKLWLQE
jgi:hypothetical protein